MEREQKLTETKSSGWENRNGVIFFLTFLVTNLSVLTGINQAWRNLLIATMVLFGWMGVWILVIKSFKIMEFMLKCRMSLAVILIYIQAAIFLFFVHMSLMMAGVITKGIWVKLLAFKMLGLILFLPICVIMSGWFRSKTNGPVNERKV